MTLNLIKILLLLAFLSASFSSIANAHRPYAIKQKIIVGPDNQNLIIEKLYGDGVIMSDPVMLQIRNSNGAIIANSPTDDNVSFLCPSLSNCWVFPYGSIFPMAKGYKLDAYNLDYKKTIAAKDIPKEDLAEFENYLKDENQEAFHSYSLDYPELNEIEAYGFLYNPLSYFISPYAIILDKIIIYFVVIFVAYLQTKIFSQISNSQSNIDRKSLMTSILLIICYILLLAFSLIDFIVLIGVVFASLIPMFYFIASAALGIFLAIKKATPEIEVAPSKTS